MSQAAPLGQITTPTWATDWKNLSSEQANAKARRLFSAAPSACFRFDLMIKNSERVVFTQWHSVAARVSIAAASAKFHLVYGKVAAVVQAENGIPRDKFDDLIRVLHKHQFVKLLDARDADPELIKAYCESSKKRFDHRGKILLSEKMGRAASEQLDYFFRRIIVDQRLQPLDSNSEVTLEEIERRVLDEEVYRRLLAKDSARHPCF